jgi:prevent-host-death family protein
MATYVNTGKVNHDHSWHAGTTRQFKQLLRQVRDEGEVIEITMRSEPIARIVLMKRQPPSREELAKEWADLDQLAAEIAANWKDESDAVEVVREQRRDL